MDDEPSTLQSCLRKMVGFYEATKKLLTKEDKKNTFTGQLQRFICIKKETDSKLLIDCFETCLKSSNETDIYQFLEFHQTYFPDPQRLGLFLHLVIIRNQNIELVQKLIELDADLNIYYNAPPYNTPLETAIKYSNTPEILELLLKTRKCKCKSYDCPLLYAFRNGTPSCIQKVLIEYEENFSECNPILIEAFIARCPFIEDLIKKGAPLNCQHSYHNVISVAIMESRFYEPRIFKLLWDKFDYEIWKITFSKCVLLKALDEFYYLDSTKFKGYLDVLMENEEKLRLDIEHHNNSPFWKVDSLIFNLYSCCTFHNLPANYVQNNIIHLLSHGAMIFFKTVSYMNVYEEDRIFLRILSMMDFHVEEDSPVCHSFFYFLYNLTPDLEKYFVQLCEKVLDGNVQTKQCEFFLLKVRSIFAFTCKSREIINEMFEEELKIKEEFLKILNESYNFPSLSQLAREATRKTLCDIYNIKSARLLYSRVQELDIPKCIKEILVYDREIY